MDYLLTQHAREVVAERGVRMAWLEQVLAAPVRVEPDPVDPALEHRIGRVASFGNRALRVVVTRDEHPPRIITAFFDRRLREDP